jgi:hypothetical protein
MGNGNTITQTLQLHQMEHYKFKVLVLRLIHNPNNVLTDKRSIWARATTGSGNVKLMSHNSNTNNIFTLTTIGSVLFLPSYSSNLANNFMQLILDQVQLLTIYYFGIVKLKQHK